MERLERKPNPKAERTMPALRFAIVFAGFIAFDVAAYLLLKPRFDAAMEANRTKDAQQKAFLEETTFRPPNQGKAQFRQLVLAPEAAPVPAPPQDPVIYASTLPAGDKCAGGLVYQSENVDGVKVITLRTNNGRPVRCR